MRHIVYKLYYNNSIYVGLTSGSLKTRLYKHKAAAKKSNKPLYKAMRLYGSNKFKIEVIKRYSTREEAREAEKHYIEDLSTLNIIRPSSEVLNEIKSLEQRIEILKKLL